MANEIALIPVSDLKVMAEALGKTKMFGKSPEEIFPLMLIAQAEGKHPALAAQEYDIIQGRPALNAKSIQARFQTAGGKVRWDVRSDNETTVTVVHPAGGEVKITWDMKRAKQAGLTGKDNWAKFPQQMLSARAISEAVRACFPACLNGMYAVEEIQDGVDFQSDPSEPRNVTPARGTAAEDLADKLDQRPVEAVVTKTEPETAGTGLF